MHRYKNFKILIIEDNDILANTMQEMLQIHGFKVVKTLDSGDRFKSYLKSEEPDLVLLDIQLNGDLDGIELGEMVREVRNIPIIFVTSFSDKQILERVKKVSPEGYILKPFTFETLTTNIEVILEKFYFRKDQNFTSKPEIEKEKKDYLFIRDRGWLKKILIKDIEYIKTEGSYTHINLGETTYTLRAPVKDILQNLPEYKFQRVHRSYIVNCDNVKAFNKKEIIVNNQSIPVGRNYYSEIQSTITKINN